MWRQDDRWIYPQNVRHRRRGRTSVSKMCYANSGRSPIRKKRSTAVRERAIGVGRAGLVLKLMIQRSTWAARSRACAGASRCRTRSSARSRSSRSRRAPLVKLMRAALHRRRRRGGGDKAERRRRGGRGEGASRRRRPRRSGRESLLRKPGRAARPCGRARGRLRDRGGRVALRVAARRALRVLFCACLTAQRPVLAVSARRKKYLHSIYLRLPQQQRSARGQRRCARRRAIDQGCSWREMAPRAARGAEAEEG